MDKISKRDEERIVRVIEKVADLVNDGTDQNNAIAKIASELKLPLGHIDLVVHAYNTSRTNMQRKSSDDIYEKAAEFPIADVAEILKIMYPDKVTDTPEEKKASVPVSAEYSQEPIWVDRLQKSNNVKGTMSKEAFAKQVKLCEAPPPYDTESTTTKKAYAEIQAAKHRLDDFKMAACRLQMECTKVASNIRDYFKTPGCIDIDEVVQYAELMFGKAASDSLAAIGLSQATVKKAGYKTPADWRQVSRHHEPYSSINSLIKLQAVNKSLGEKLAQATKAVAKLEDQFLRPFVLSPRTQSVLTPLSSNNEKQGWSVLGGVFGSGSALLGGGEKAQKAVEQLEFAKPTEKLLAKDLQKLVDPVHESNIREAQVEAMLNDLMANDEIVSSHKPDDVVRIFNEINQIAPRAANQKMLVRALLRKRLQYGGDQVDPFDVQQLLDIETKLKEREALGRGGMPGAMGLGPVGPIGQY